MVGHQISQLAKKLPNRKSPDLPAVLTSDPQLPYRSLSPKQIVPKLADKNIYLASERTFYRILRDEDMMHHPGRTSAPSKAKTDSHTATGPNQLWSWDITYLASSVKGMFFYLY